MVENESDGGGDSDGSIERGRDQSAHLSGSDSDRRRLAIH